MNYTLYYLVLPETVKPKKIAKFLMNAFVNQKSS